MAHIKKCRQPIDGAGPSDYCNAPASAGARCYKCEVDYLRTKVRDMREVLGFYADPKSWFTVQDRPEYPEGIIMNDLWYPEAHAAVIMAGFGGKRAREVLAKYGDKLEGV